MEQYKKNIFFKDFHIPIHSEAISDNDKQEIEDYISQNIRHEIGTASLFPILAESILTKKKLFKSVDRSADIEQILQLINARQLHRVNVIWNYPIDIETFEIDYLVKYWEYLWFGESDDAIALFFPEIEKIILITHYGTVYYS